MCCRTEVFPLDRKVAEIILELGMFEQYAEASWRRRIEEEGTSVVANFNDVDNCLTLILDPAISQPQHHLGHRLVAGVYFEIAAKYAEKVSGEIWQKATVSGCKPPNSSDGGLLVASYPSIPMTFDRVCAGFQAVILGA